MKSTPDDAILILLFIIGKNFFGVFLAQSLCIVLKITKYISNEFVGKIHGKCEKYQKKTPVI